MTALWIVLGVVVVIFVAFVVIVVVPVVMLSSGKGVDP